MIMYLHADSKDCFQSHFLSFVCLKSIFVSYLLSCAMLSYSLNYVEAETTEELCEKEFDGIWRNSTYFETNHERLTFSPVCYINKPKDLDFTCINNGTISVQRSFYQGGVEFAVTCRHSHKLHFDYDGVAHDIPIMIFKSSEMGPRHEYMLTYSFNASSSNSTGKYTVTTETGLKTSLYIFFSDSKNLIKPDCVNQPIEISFRKAKDNNSRKNSITDIIPCRSANWNATVEIFNLTINGNTEKLNWFYDAKIGFFSPPMSLINNSTLLLCSADYPVNNDSLLFKLKIEESDDDTSLVDTAKQIDSEPKKQEEDDYDDSIVKFEKTVATCFGKGSARFDSIVNIHTYNPSESQLYNFINEIYIQEWRHRNISNAKLPLDKEIKVEMCSGAQWCNINDIFPSGLILCIGTQDNKSFILRQEYFTCLHGVKFPHIKSRELISFPLEALLQMKILTDLDSTIDDIEIDVECTTAKYIFMDPNKWTLSYQNYNDSIQEMPGDGGLSLEYKHNDLAKNVETKSFKVHRNFNTSVEITCEATFWDTSYTKSFHLKLPERQPYRKSGAHTIIVSSIIVVIITTGFVAMYFLNRRNKNMLGFTEAQIQQFLNGNPQAFYCCQEKRGDLLPYDKNFELSEQNYEIFTNIILGSGEFGIVYKGRVNGMEAAVKTIKIETANNEYLAALLSELKIMIYLEKHENIVNLLGACTKGLNIGRAYIFVEFCSLGSLEDYLRNHRGKLHSKRVSEEGYTIKDLVNWSFQISRGMDHLSNKHVIHGDLATRNVLLKDRYTVKISDFGLSCKLYNYKRYVKKNDSVPLPWRWMSIESLRNLSFSCQSDVWSYGVTLWEIFSLGQVPYMWLSFDDCFVEKIATGLRNQKPVYASEEIYEVMKQCWQQEPCLRPSFANLSFFFNNLLTAWTKESAESSQSSVAPYVTVKNDLGYTMMVW